MKFEKFKPCHVIIRAVDKRPIFTDIEDCSRYIFQVYATNIGKPSYNIFRKNVIYIADELLRGNETPWKIVINKISPLVDVLSFALVRDRAHFILSPNVEDGIPRYIHKVSLSFAKYYNNRHKREGVLFNKPYRIIPLDTVADLDNTMRYVNVKTALDVYNPDWKKGIENWKKAFDFVDQYRYSSYQDLFGNRNSKLLASKDIVSKYLGGEINKDKIKNIDFIEKYINGDLENSKKIFLER